MQHLWLGEVSSLKLGEWAAHVRYFQPDQKRAGKRLFPHRFCNRAGLEENPGFLKVVGCQTDYAALAFARATAISSLEREPLSMLADESHGLRSFTIIGRYFLSASATARLRWPDQLMNTSIFAMVSKL
jgi:hypothetical protein